MYIIPLRPVFENYMKLEETVRQDGLRIVTCRVPSKKVYFELLARVGSAYDPDDKCGLFHYFEHMAFKGTSTRTVEALQSFISRNLLDSNASTGKVETRYFGSAIHKKTDRLIDVIADAYCNSVFPVEEIEREKKVVLMEIARNKDNDNRAAYHAMTQALWKRNPLRKVGTGTPDGVRSVSRINLIEARDRWYCPSNTIAIACGNITHQHVVDEINRHIPIRMGNIEHPTWPDEYDMSPAKKEVVLLRSEREKAVLLFACKFPLIMDPRLNMAARFMVELHSGKNSILWKELREKRGLAYAIDGGIADSYPLGACLVVRTEILPSSIDTAREIISRVLFQPLNDPTHFEEVRESFTDKCVLGIEDVDDWADIVIEEIERGSTPLKKLERYIASKAKIVSTITLEEVEAFRKKMLRPENFSTIIVRSK